MYLILLLVTWYLCHKWARMCSFCRNHNPVLSAFMIYIWACTKSYTTNTWVHPITTFSFLCIVLQMVVCPFVHFMLVILLSFLLRLTASDHHFGMFSLLLCYLLIFGYRLYIIFTIKQKNTNLLAGNSKLMIR